ncbi:MAG: HU family DNA-binding protein [Pirellulales bacterium]
MPDKTQTAKPMNKTEFINSLSGSTGLSKEQVSNVLEGLRNLISENLSEGGPGAVSIPGLMKVKVVRKPAVPERKGLNPFTKEETVFKAKPARNVVKIQPLKALKDAV